MKIPGEILVNIIRAIGESSFIEPEKWRKYLFNKHIDIKM